MERTVRIGRSAQTTRGRRFDPGTTRRKPERKGSTQETGRDHRRKRSPANEARPGGWSRDKASATGGIVAGIGRNGCRQGTTGAGRAGRSDGPSRKTNGTETGKRSRIGADHPGNGFGPDASKTGASTAKDGVGERRWSSGSVIGPRTAAGGGWISIQGTIRTSCRGARFCPRSTDHGDATTRGSPTRARRRLSRKGTRIFVGASTGAPTRSQGCGFGIHDSPIAGLDAGSSTRTRTLRQQQQCDGKRVHRGQNQLSHRCRVKASSGIEEGIRGRKTRDNSSFRGTLASANPCQKCQIRGLDPERTSSCSQCPSRRSREGKLQSNECHDFSSFTQI
mmetsp:Transcript_20077/g.55835  ORF Transcript_20077/g.55835 Transcript_20077/m.55835 type:complete len:336 (-) Transcript_20077:478-1485(-)